MRPRRRWSKPGIRRFSDVAFAALRGDARARAQDADQATLIAAADARLQG